MFDLGVDVEMTEYQENMETLLSIFDADTSFDEVASIISLRTVVWGCEIFASFC
jgi:hypothetical protein